MGYFFKKTSAAEPEQYDVFGVCLGKVDAKPLAYVKLRYGQLTVMAYRYDGDSQSVGDVIYMNMFSDEELGTFTDAEDRVFWLGEVVAAIDRYFSE